LVGEGMATAAKAAELTPRKPLRVNVSFSDSLGMSITFRHGKRIHNWIQIQS
jgi:hypothetical protein